MVQVISPHAAGDRGRFLLRLDAVAVSKLDTIVLLPELSAEPDAIGILFGRRLPCRRDRRHLGRRGERPDPAPHRRPGRGTAQRYRGRYARRLSVPDSGDPGSRRQRRGDLTRRGILFRRTGGRPDLGSTDGHRAKIFGIGERHDEFRLRRCRHHFTFRVWLSDRQDRKLDLAICRLDWPFVARRRACVSHASGAAIRGGARRWPLLIAVRLWAYTSDSPLISGGLTTTWVGFPAAESMPRRAELQVVLPL